MLVIDSDTKRSHWKMAIVVNVYPGKDGLVQSVQVKTDSGIYDRPVTKLGGECEIGLLIYDN